MVLIELAAIAQIAELSWKIFDWASKKTQNELENKSYEQEMDELFARIKTLLESYEPDASKGEQSVDDMYERHKQLFRCWEIRDKSDIAPKCYVVEEILKEAEKGTSCAGGRCRNVREKKMNRSNYCIYHGIPLHDILKATDDEEAQALEDSGIIDYLINPKKSDD